MLGRIHSFESFGTVDGPGIRYVLFLQGCPMRCQYCHNPDTWDINAGKTVSPDEIIADFLKNKEFYKNGGITVSGGEPLLQIEFLTELFSKAKVHNIHTCIDTSGITFKREDTTLLEKLSTLLSLTDLVMLDIKHIDEDYHKKLTGFSNENVLEFAKYLSQKNIPIWIRHVVIRDFLQKTNDLVKLGKFIGELNSLKALDVIPYHTMGVHKYKGLGLTYPLEGLEPTTKQEAATAKKHILIGIKSTKK